MERVVNVVEGVDVGKMRIESMDGEEACVVLLGSVGVH